MKRGILWMIFLLQMAGVSDMMKIGRTEVYLRDESKSIAAILAQDIGISQRLGEYLQGRSYAFEYDDTAVFAPGVMFEFHLVQEISLLAVPVKTVRVDRTVLLGARV